MKRFKSHIILLSLVLGPYLSLVAQLTGYNTAEFQYGNIPGLEPKDQSSLYDQLDLKYRYKKLSVFTKLEAFQPSFGEDNSYAKLTQFRANYNTKSLSLDLGHNYASLGRGLLMRNYSLPSSIYEDRGYRIRYGYQKDIFGAAAKYKSEYVDVKLMRGTVLAVGLPPTFSDEERRRDLVEGGEVTFKLKNQSLGVMAMRHVLGENQNEYGGLYLNANVGEVSLYGELAKRFDDETVVTFNEASSYGAYLGLNYSYGNFGLSFELKKYQDFLIGNGVNDPPSLVREHAVRLLNRSTHVPFLSDESGYQVELYYTFDNGHMLTVNNALAKNKLGLKTHIYQELYADYYMDLSDNFQVRMLADYAQNPLMNESYQLTTGANVDYWHGALSSNVSFYIQKVKRNIGTNRDFMNASASYTLSKAGKFSAAALLEWSNDPFLLEEDKTQVFYPAAVFAYHLDSHNKISAFVGKRRGGPSCTSGVCYDVLDFEGVELRLSTVF